MAPSQRSRRELRSVTCRRRGGHQHVRGDDQLRQRRLGHRSRAAIATMRVDPVTGRPWPAMPPPLRRLALARRRRAPALPALHPILPDQPLRAGSAACHCTRTSNERDFTAPDRLGLARAPGDFPLRRLAPRATGRRRVAARKRRRRGLGRAGTARLPRRRAARRRRACAHRALPHQPDLPQGALTEAARAGRRSTLAAEALLERNSTKSKRLPIPYSSCPRKRASMDPDFRARGCTHLDDACSAAVGPSRRAPSGRSSG